MAPAARIGFATLTCSQPAVLQLASTLFFFRSFFHGHFHFNFDF